MHSLFLNVEKHKLCGLVSDVGVFFPPVIHVIGGAIQKENNTQKSINRSSIKICSSRQTRWSQSWFKAITRMSG